MDKASKILITGANGLLGSYILRYMVKLGYTNIMALVRANGRMELIPKDILSKIEIIHGNILDFDLVNQLSIKSDYIIHAAAEVHFDKRKSKELYKTNVEGTANIVDCCLENGIKKLIYISSTAALGRIYDGQIITEKTMWEKSELNTQYAISKHYGEREIWRGHEEGLNIGIINPSLIITPGFFDKSSAGIYTRLYKNFNYYPKGTNGIVDVRDVAIITIKILENEINNLKIIACSENIKYKDLFGKIALNFGNNPPSKVVKPYQRKILQYYYNFRSLFGKKSDISKASLLNASINFLYDNNLSIELLSHEYIDSNITISQACEAFKKATNSKKDFCILSIE